LWPQPQIIHLLNSGIDADQQQRQANWRQRQPALPEQPDDERGAAGQQYRQYRKDE
jgi:hypothetical protein